MLGQHELAPGQETELVIVYNTYKFPGKFNKFVTIFTDLDSQKELRIDIRGFVKAIPMGVLEATPRKIEMGTVQAGVPAKGVVHVKNSGNASMKVTKVVAKKQGTVYFEGEILIGEGETRAIPFELTAETTGRFLDYILIHSDARNVTDKGYKVVIKATAK